MNIINACDIEFKSGSEEEKETMEFHKDLCDQLSSRLYVAKEKTAEIKNNLANRYYDERKFDGWFEYEEWAKEQLDFLENYEIYNLEYMVKKHNRLKEESREEYLKLKKIEKFRESGCEMDKKKVITFLENGISLEAVVKEMAMSTGDEEFIRKVELLLGIQQFPDKKKDLEFKFEVLTTKINMLDDHLKIGLDREYTLEIADKYCKTLKRMEKAMQDK